MPEILLLIPPNKEGFIRDTYYGCWHKRKFINYSWPPLYLYQLNSIIKNSKIVDLSELSFEYGLNYFKNAKNLEIIPDNMQETEIRLAFEHLEKFGWNKEELEEYDRVGIAKQNYRA